MLSRRLLGSTTVKAAGRFLRQQLWAWPLIAATILGAAAYFVHGSVERAMRSQRVAELTTILKADVEAVRVWMTEQGDHASTMAENETLRRALQQLLTVAEGAADPTMGLLQSKAQADVRSTIGVRLKKLSYVGYFVVSKAGVVVACDQDGPVGKPLDGYRRDFFQTVLDSRQKVSKPYRSHLLLADETGAFRADLPTMFAAAPIPDDSGKPKAVLGLRIRPDFEFTKILGVAQAGESGETYAFDREGLLLSNSRFDDELKSIGLLTDLPDSQSVLTVQLRDPGVDMTAGERPALRRPDQPLTRNVAEAAEGRDGSDADGYRDYRGVPVVGAWMWLPEFDFGVATQIDKQESFAPVYILRRSIWGLLGLLAVAAVGIYVAMFFLARQQKMLQTAVLQAKQLGQYSLETKIGSGGMGSVYKARHAMLRRPTAVKLLDVDKTSAAMLARFEREVQITGTLTHPNTVAIYDYGRTPEGIFYYAMEYLEGISLEELVTRFGPIPEPRLLYLMRQVCGSLAEAHAAGLVHRDVKPANIFLTRRGGMHDFVKVLDFGLVKSVDGAEHANLTSVNAVTGTPLYLSPEAVSQPELVDPRSDVYAIGGVLYFLLTGTPVFTGTSVMEICMKQVNEAPAPPSERLGRPVDPGLERLILQCLSKAKSDRPADAAAVLRSLEALSGDEEWTLDDAAAWWAVHRVGDDQMGLSGEIDLSKIPTATSAIRATVEFQRGA